MGRSRSSAKQAGTRFERLIADTFAWHYDDRVDRRVKRGAKDCGDIANVRTPGNRRIVVECKDCSRPDLAGWAKQAEVERENDDAVAGITVHKRRGHGGGLDQWVTMTMRDFISILNDERPKEFRKKLDGDEIET